MNTYRISTTVKSTLVSVKGKTAGDFHIYTPDTQKPHELIIERDIEGSDWKNALDTFRKDCMKMIDSLSLASGAPATWLTSSYLVEKQGEEVVILCILTESREARVPITDTHMLDAKSLYTKLPQTRDGLSNLRMAISMRNANLKLLLTLFAAENIAGEEEVHSKCYCGADLKCEHSHIPKTTRTNKKRLIEILGEDLHKQFFKGRKEYGNKSIRTMFAHGKELALRNKDIEKIEEMLLKLINTVRAEVGLNPISTTSSFDDLVQVVEPWLAVADRKNIYDLIQARLNHDMTAIGYEGVYQLEDDY